MWRSEPIGNAACSMLLALSLLCAAAAAADESDLRPGQSLAEALQLLSQRHGLSIVFSADLVPAQLRITSVPTAKDPKAQRDALLRAHGLVCRALLGRCVVERVAAPAAPAEPLQAARLPRVEVAPSHYSLGNEGATFLSAADIAATPHLADDVFRLARSIPGVAGGDIGAPFHVRGGNSDEIALRLDGLELYKPFHLHNLQNALGIVDSNLIGGIDVYTGAWPSRFGGRTSAIVDIRSREVADDRERRLGVSAINAFYTHAAASADGERSLLASARRGYLDVVLKFADPDGAIDPGYYDVFTRYRQQIGDRHAVSAHLLHAGDDIVFDGDEGTQRSDGSSDASYLWLGWQADWSDALTSETVLAHSRLDRRREGFAFDRFETNAIVFDQRELGGLRISHQLDWQLGERAALAAGVEWRDESSDYDYRSQVEVYPLFGRLPTRYTRRSQVEVDSGQQVLWLDGQALLTPRWQLRGGLRASRYRLGDRHSSTLDPQLALAFAPRDGSRLRIGLGGASQMQRSDELAIEDGDLRQHPAERARLAVLGWEQALSPRLGLRVELFDKRWSRVRPRYENLFEPIELFPETEGDRVLIAAQRASSRGIEVGLDGRFDSGRWWLRYAWSRSRERVDSVWQPRSWDQPHALHAGWDRSFDNGWRFTAQLEAHSGWPTTPVAVREVDGGFEAVIGARNSQRFDSYINLSARISRQWPLADGTLTAYFEAFNLLNRENGNLVDQFTLVRDSDGTLQVRRSLGGGLPLLPSFGVVWTF
jgi:hypothetical protein